MVLGLLITLALALSVVMAVPVYAADVGLTKGVTPATPNAYRLGDTIHYVMSVWDMSVVEDIVVEEVWDVLPDGSTVYPTGPALPYTLTPGANQSYTYDWVATVTGTVVNTFYARGYQISTGGGHDAWTQSVQKSSSVIDPAIHIEKSTNGQDADLPTGPYIAVGGPVTWEYVITNPGDSLLSNITVTDSEAGVTPVYVSGDTSNVGFLDLTETWIYQANGTAAAGQYSNTGTATGTPLVGSNVSDDDPSHYFGSEACIHIEKSTNGEDADSPTGPYIPIGGVVTWTYNVTNCGSVNLTNIVVTDDNGTPGNLADDFHPTRIGGDNGDNVLQTTEAWIYQANSTAAAGQYANNSTVTGIPPVGSPVSDDDLSHYFGSAACIHIEKSTNGEDADSPTGPYIPVGGVVTWTYNVTNCGSVNLTNIVVTDDNGTPGNLADDFHPTRIGGDNGDNVLQTTEAWIYQANSTAVAGQYANNSTVTGTPPVGSNVSDDDPSHYFGLGPAIDIEKHTNGVDADSAPGPYISINSTVTWTYIVTNTGAVNLTGIVVTDNKPGVTPLYVSGGDGNAILSPGEVWTYQAGGVAVAGQYANVGTVVGYYGAVQVTDSDPSHYYNRPQVVGWETYPVNKVHVLLPWIALLAAIIVGASLLVLRRRRAQN
jgi:large repetitive protein